MNLTTTQLVDLTAFVAERIAEFGDFFEPVSAGMVRVIHTAICEWEGKQDEDLIEDYANARAAAYAKGLDDGYALGRAEAAPELPTVRRDDADDKELNKEFYQELQRRQQEPPADDDDPEPDRDTDAETGRQLFSELVRRRRTFDPGPLTNEQADAINRHNGVPGWRPGEEYGEPLTPQAAATLGPEHVVVNPVRPKPIGTARDPLPDPDVAREKLAHAVANGSNGDLAKAINKPRTLAEADATLRGGVGADEDEPDPDAIPKRGRKHNVVNYEQMVAELQRQAMAGVMPSQADFNYSKPAVWPVASSLCTRFGASWDELRQAAGLKCNPKAERYAKVTV